MVHILFVALTEWKKGLSKPLRIKWLRKDNNLLLFSLHSNTEKKYNVHTLHCHGMGSSEVIQCAACKDKHRANVIL